nr:unnamed protein product [Spirometra erinaceieuropaei]
MTYNKYTFSRLLAGNLTVNCTLPASHRIRQLFSLVSAGSGKFTPCFDHSRLLVLPPQSPVDSWILHDRIAQLNAFLPIQVSRVELSSVTLNIHPPTHNLSILSDLACIRLRTGPLLMLSCEPADPVHMVSTMTHLQPSTGVLEALASTLEGVADQPLLASEDFWGRHSQWVGCYGDPHSQPVPTATAAAEAAEIDDVLATATISGITRSLQMRLLNACYTRRLYSLAELSLEFLPPNQNCRTLMSFLEVKLFQRDLFYPTSWPEQLGHGLVTRESIAQISPEIRLQLSSMDLCQVVLFISSLTAEDHSFAAPWNNHPSSSQPFSEVVLRRLFDPPSEDASSPPSADLLITMKGKFAIQNRPTPAGGLFSLCLRTPEVSGALLFATSFLPIFERRSFSVCPALDWNRAAAKAEIAKASVWVLPVLRPLSLTLSFAAPICDSTLYLGRPRVVAGCGLEMNLDSDFVCTLYVPLIGQCLAGLTDLVANRAVSTPGPAPPPQPRTLVEATPTRLLLTGGLVRFVAWTELANSASSPAVCLLVADFIQPHLLWRRNTPWLDSAQAAALEFGLNNLQLYSRVVEHDWCSQRWRHSVRWQITQPASTRVTPPFCLPRSLPLPLVASPLQAAGALFDQKPPLHERAFISSSASSSSTVDGGLLRVRLLRSHQPAVHVTTQLTRCPTIAAAFKLDACVQRDLLITFTPTSVGALTSLIDSFVINMPALPSHKETKNPTTDIQKTASFHQGPSTPVDSCSVKTTRIKLLLVGDDAGCALSLSAESFCLDGAFDGSAHWSRASHTATLKWLDISWDRPSSPPSPNSAFRFLSSPSSVHCVLSTSSEPACSSTSRLLKVHLSPGPRLMFPVGGTVSQDLQALLRAYAEPTIPGPRRPPARKLSAGRSTPKAQVFYDDLRTNPLFQFSAVAESASSDRLPLPYEVVFCTLTEPRECIAMVWAYPLPRQPVRLQLSPIPIACRDEALLDTSDIELSCELQYLDEDSGDFLTYREFSICESRATEVPLPGLAAVSHESCPSDLLSSQQQLQHQGALEVTAMATPEGNFCWGGGLDRRTMDGLTEFRKRMDTDWSSGCSGRAEGGHSPKYLSTGHTVAIESTTPKSARVWRVLVNCFGRRVSKQNNTDKEIVVEQCLPRHKMGPLIDETSSAQTVVCLQSLQNIHRLHLTPGECHVWRPSHLSFPSDLTGPMSRQQISLRIGLIDSWGCSKTTRTCHWSYPLHLVWPPATRKASAPVDGISAMVEVAWPSEPGGPASAARGLHPMSQLSLLLMQSPASGLPGELVIQAGLLLHNLLPHSLHFRLGWRAQRGGFSNEGVILPRSRLAIYLPTTVPPQPLNSAEQSTRMKFIISLSASEGWTPFSLAIPTAPTSSDSPEDAARFVKRRLIQLSLPDGSYNASFPILFTSRLCHIGEMAHPFLVLSFSSPLTITNHLPLPLTLTSCSPKEMSFVRATSEDAVQTPSFSSSDVFSVKAASEGVPVLATGVEDFHFAINYDNGDPVFAAPFKLQLSELLERLFQLNSCTTPSGSDASPHSQLPTSRASRVMLGLSPISPPPIRTGLAEEGFELVILPWLLLRNRSGLDLWIYTSAGAQKEDARCHLHRLAAGTSYMPPSGQRLFRLGLSGDDGREAVSWSSSMLLVHKSAFAAAVSAATTGRAAGPRAYLTASESPQSNTTMAGPKDSAASVNPLLPSRPSLVVTIPMSNNRVCCLSVELRVVDLSVPANGPGGCPQSLPPPPPPQVQVVISPHVRFVNRSGCPLLLKLLALRFEPTQPPVPLEKFDDHPLSLPGSSSFSTTSSSVSTSSASTVDGYFWKSCSRSERPPGPSGPLDLRYFMAIRAPSSKWWSQCLELSLCRTATITPEDDENTAAAAVRVGCTHLGPHSQSCVAVQYRHFSFMLSDADGGPEELSILVSMYRGEHSVFTELVFDRLPDPMRQCLACCLHNLTSEPFQVALEPTSETPPPLSGHLPTLAPSGGQLVLLPQSELDCFCQPSSTEPPQDAGHVHGSCSFLAQGSVALRFQSASNTQTFHLDLTDLLTTNGTAVLQPATTASPAICAKVKRDTSSTAPFHVIIVISAQDDPDQPEAASLVAPSYPYPCSSYFLHIDHLTIPICSAVSFGSGDYGAAMGVAQRPDEFMRLSVSCLQAAIMLDYRDDNCALTDFHLSSSFLQLDNRAHGWTNLFDFPVLLRSALTPASQAVTSTGSLFCLRGRSTDLGVQWIEAELPHLEVFLEDSAVSTVIRWAQDLHMALANVPGWGEKAASRPQPASPTLMYLRHLRIAPLSLQVALQAAVGVHLSCKSTRLRLAPFQLLTGAGRNSGVVITPACLLGQLGVHYISQAIFRAGWLLGGLELIGNPAGLVSAFADGVWDLVHFTDTTSPPSLQQAQRIDREERLSLLRGFASGLTSLTKHATGGVISSVTGLAANFARNMHALSMDSEHVQRVTLSRQRTGEPNSLFHGVRLGLSEFGVSLLGGLAGIAHHPLRAVMPSIDEPSSPPPPPPVLATHRPPSSPQRSALPPTDAATAVGAISRLAGALVTGLGRGLVGVVAKPLAGAADLVAMTGAGFMHGMGVGWGVNLTPRHLTGPLETGLDLPPVDTLLLSRWAHALLTQSSAQCIWSGLARSGTSDRTWLALLSLLPPACSILYIVRFGDSTTAPLPLLLCVAPIDISTSADTSAPAQVAVSRAIELLLGPSELLFNGDDKAALLCAVERWASYSHCQMSRQDDEQESEKLERVRAYLSSLSD